MVSGALMPALRVMLMILSKKEKKKSAIAENQRAPWLMA